LQQIPKFFLDILYMQYTKSLKFHDEDYYDNLKNFFLNKPNEKLAQVIWEDPHHYYSSHLFKQMSIPEEQKKSYMNLSFMKIQRRVVKLTQRIKLVFKDVRGNEFYEQTLSYHHVIQCPFFAKCLQNNWKESQQKAIYVQSPNRDINKADVITYLKYLVEQKLCIGTKITKDFKDFVNFLMDIQFLAKLDTDWYPTGDSLWYFRKDDIERITAEQFIALPLDIQKQLIKTGHIINITFSNIPDQDSYVVNIGRYYALRCPFF